MLRKTVILPFLASLVLLSLALTLSASASVAVSAKHAILIDAQSGEILWERASNDRAPMASTTKIMTAVAALEALSPDTTVCVPKEATAIEGTSAYLKEGELLSVKDLLYALLLQSANDAAVALAIAADGSISAFAGRMNRIASELDLKDTRFQNPHGLPAEEHYTTAKELALLTAYALHNPLFAKIVDTQSYTCRTSLCSRTFVNHNKLLRMSEDAVGVKTGFTKTSGRCLVGAAKRDDTLLVSVTLSAPDDWRDHLSLWRYGFSLLGVSAKSTASL